MTHFTWRWLPVYRYLRKLVDGGYVGRCYQCYMSFLGGPERDPHYRWRFDKNRSNGVISDYGAHMIDLARWLVGDVAKVSAHLSSFIDRLGIDGRPCESCNDTATVAMQFVNGAQGMIQVSDVVHMGDRLIAQKVILMGDSGTLEVDHSFARVFDPHAVLGTEIRGTRSGDKKFETLSIPDEYFGKAARENLLAPYVLQSVGARRFIDSILNDEPSVPSFYEGWKVQEVIDAAIESFNGDRWISIQESS
jgi:predicted dehydrogenase